MLAVLATIIPIVLILTILPQRRIDLLRTAWRRDIVEHWHTYAGAPRLISRDSIGFPVVWRRVPFCDQWRALVFSAFLPASGPGRRPWGLNGSTTARVIFGIRDGHRPNDATSSTTRGPPDGDRWFLREGPPRRYELPRVIR